MAASSCLEAVTETVKATTGAVAGERCWQNLKTVEMEWTETEWRQRWSRYLAIKGTGATAGEQN